MSPYTSPHAVLLAFLPLFKQRTIKSMTFERCRKNVGRNIKAARVKAGLRQIDIEEKVGINSRYYQYIEAGTVNVTLKTLYTLATLFDVTIEDLVKA